MLVDFVNKLSSEDSKNRHIGQDPVLTRRDQDTEQTVISDDEDEPLGMPENMDGPDRTPTKNQ